MYSTITWWACAQFMSLNRTAFGKNPAFEQTRRWRQRLGPTATASPGREFVGGGCRLPVPRSTIQSRVYAHVMLSSITLLLTMHTTDMARLADSDSLDVAAAMAQPPLPRTDAVPPLCADMGALHLPPCDICNCIISITRCLLLSVALRLHRKTGLTLPQRGHKSNGNLILIHHSLPVTLET